MKDPNLMELERLHDTLAVRDCGAGGPSDQEPIAWAIAEIERLKHRLKDANKGSQLIASLKPGDKIRRNGSIFTVSRNHHPAKGLIECTDEGGSGYSLLASECDRVTDQNVDCRNRQTEIEQLRAALEVAQQSLKDRNPDVGSNPFSGLPIGKPGQVLVKGKGWQDPPADMQP